MNLKVVLIVDTTGKIRQELCIRRGASRLYRKGEYYEGDKQSSTI